MRRLETQSLERFNDTEIDPPAVFNVEIADRQLDFSTFISNTPIVTSSYDGHYDSQLVLATDRGLPAWDDEAHYPVGRLDRIHGRNLEVLADNVFVEDSFGNEFFSLCLKGADLSDPHFIKTRTAAREFIICGLQESIVMERVIRASKTLREQGIGTEYICGLALPMDFPLDREDTGIDDKPSVELPELLEHLATRFATRQQVWVVAPRPKDGEKDKDQDYKTPLEVKLDMIERFKDCDYMVSYRAMDCPYRAGELSSEVKFKAFKQFIANRLGQTELGQFIKDIDEEQYIQSIFTYNLARNVAGMHAASLRHGFLVPNNISALGSIIDLDSCRGEPLGLGDQTTTIKDQAYDVAECLRTIHNIVYGLRFNKGGRVENYISRLNLEHFAAGTFIKYYLETRFDKVSERVEFLADMLRLASDTRDSDFKGDDGLDVYRLAQQVIDSYNALTRVTALETAPTVQTLEPGLKRSTSFVKTLPPKFFRDMRQTILDEAWTMNEELKKEFRTKRPVYNPLKPMMQGLVLEQIFENQKHEEKARLSAANLLFLVGCSFDRYKPRRQDRRQAVQTTKEQLQAQTSAVIDSLSIVEPDAIGSILKPFIENVLASYEEQIGSINLTGESLPDTDVLYLESDEQYEAVLKALGIDNKTSIVTMTHEFLDSLISEHARLGIDSIIIADYKVAKWIAEATTRKQVAATLLKPRPNAKPMLIISGLSNGKPTVYIQPTPFMDTSKLHHSLDELLDGVAPSVAPFQPRLFSMGVTYTPGQ